MHQVFRRPRVAAIALLMIASSFAIADAAVTITAPTRNANLAPGALITATGTTTVPSYRVVLSFPGSTVAFVSKAPAGATWTMQINAPTPLGAWSLQADSFDYPAGNPAGSTSVAINVQ